MDSILVCFMILGFNLVGYTNGDEYCYHEDTGDEFCDDCCGNWPREYCCEDNWVVGVAVGCTFAALFLIGVAVVVICICIKQNGKSGRIIQPSYVTQPTLTSTVVYHVPYAQQQGMVQPQPNGGALPPIYPPPPHPPPNYTPSSQNLYGHGTSNVSEGIQSQPPASGGLPGNHRVV